MPPVYLKPNPDWADNERPTMPGSASTPYHPPWVRVAYACVAMLVGITGGLGNALVSANLPTLQGQLGLTPSEAAWLPAAYLMVNISANLMVFKFRQQYGLRLFAEIGLGIYALLTLLHLAVGSFETTVLVRAASGFAAASCSTLGTLYMIQSLPKAHTGKALVVGVGLGQLATPLAWILSPGLLQAGTWHNLYLFETGLALCAFAAVVILKLPPGVHIQAFERTDFLTFALMAPGLAMLVAALSQGYTHWWLDTPWIAALLIGAIVLITLAMLIEHHRPNPLIQTRWLFSPIMLRFVVGAFLIRFLTSEQTYGAVGMLRLLGMGPDQMQPLFVVIGIGTVLGIVISALVFSPRTLLPQVLMAILLFGVAGWLDHGRTSLDRPHDFYLSQFLVSAGAGMFMGPLVMLGISQALKQGADHVVTFIVVLSITQSLGGLSGSAVLSSYQLHREQVHSAAIVAYLDPAEGVVAQRLKLQQQIYAAVITDPVQRAAQGTAQLAATARREANVAAFDDVFSFSSALALAFLVWSFALTVRAMKRARDEAAAATAAAPSAGAPPASPPSITAASLDAASAHPQ